MAAITINLLIFSKPVNNNNVCSFRKASKRTSLVYSNRINSRWSSSLAVEPCDQLQAAAPVVDRRSGNYKPPLWDFDYVQSLNSGYKEEKYSRRASELKAQVELLIEELTLSRPAVELLELIDNLQRLGISCHYEHRIKKILNRVYEMDNKTMNREPNEKDLYSTALKFRLLRQHGFAVSEEVFDCFKNDEGEFEAILTEDSKGLLELYESSFMLIEGEDSLVRAREFATISLQKNIDQGLVLDDELSLLVRRALELPLHWSIPRTQARWFIGTYEKRPHMNPAILELAKLDFNIVQAIHQEELKSVSRWWKSTGFAEELPFVRDRAVGYYLWSIGLIEPREYGYQRIIIAMLISMVTTIDDIFDIYGTLEELHLFTNVIQRWDIELIDRLPVYMQICFLALHNFINEVAYNFLKEQGSNIIPHLRKSFTDLIATYMQEAKWYHNGDKPSLEEYLNNGKISVAGCLVSHYMYFLLTNPIKHEAVQAMYEYHNIIQLPSMIARLADDIGSGPAEMKRGDVPKAIQCYMNETGPSEKQAQKHLKFLIHETWKKINTEVLAADSPFSPTFIRCCVNVGRMTQYMYQHGDGIGVHQSVLKDGIKGLLFEPIA
uniref:Terpene synthase 13 n=1 Tax=Leucophyllum frutescens TaxID=86643 RepID=A0A7G6J4M6_LEUFR|nr:terpene synthase 13 [Leucophyllum frutescens]